MVRTSTLSTVNVAHRIVPQLVGMLIPATAFVMIVGAGLSIATLLPYTARAANSCTECHHDVTHWTCTASNQDNTGCHKLSAAYCANVQTDCVGSTTLISGGNPQDGGDGRYSISTTTY